MPRAALAAACLFLATATAAAQPVPAAGPAQRPAFSPYLNLVNRGTSPGFNYLGIVRPQQEFRRQFGQLQDQQQRTTSALQQEINGLSQGTGDPFLPTTGTVARFNDLAPYYTRNPVTGSGGGRVGGASNFGGGFASGASRAGGFGGGSRPAAGGGAASRPAGGVGGGMGGVRR